MEACAQFLRVQQALFWWIKGEGGTGQLSKQHDSARFDDVLTTVNKASG